MELTQRGVRAYLPTFEISGTYTVVNIFTVSRTPRKDGTTNELWLLLWKDSSRRGSQPLFRRCCSPRLCSPYVAEQIRQANMNLAPRASSTPIRWKWNHIYIASRAVYCAESGLETHNLLSRLSLNGPSFTVPTPPFLIPASVLQDSALKLVYVAPLESAPWTGSPPLTFIYDCTYFRCRVSVTLGCCDAAARVGHGAEAGSQSSPHFAFLRFHGADEDPASLATNLENAGEAHDCDDHIARWAEHKRTFNSIRLPTILIARDLRGSVTVSFRDCMRHISLTTLELLPMVLEHWRRS